jgi:hypothetical protein
VAGVDSYTWHAASLREDRREDEEEREVDVERRKDGMARIRT